jgi:membrane-associated phospholipid phosphatase
VTASGSLGRVLLCRFLIGLALVAAAFLVDRQAFEVIRSGTFYDHSGEVREGLTAAKFLGSGLGTVVVGLVVALVDRRGWKRAAALWLVVATAAAGGLALKGLAGRERPSHLDQPVGQERMVFRGPRAGVRFAPYQSFPSGHTLSAFAAATSLAAFYPPARAVCYAVAGASAVNRVVKHQHFLSDVVAGALMGHLWALWLLYRPAVRRWWGVEPVDSPGAHS